MVFREKTFSVMLVSPVEQFNTATVALLPQSDFWPVKCVKSAGEARRELVNKDYDLVLINTPLPDEFGTKLAVDICANGASGALLFVKNEIYDDIYSKVMEEGVMVISKPTSAMMVSQTLRIMCSARERIRHMEQKQATVEEKMIEIRLINKAKWMLIENEKMSEAEAHHYIEKNAMDSRNSKRGIAEEIIAKYS